MAETAPAHDLAGVSIFAFPYYDNNPWQRIMYKTASRSGAKVVPLSGLEELLALPIPGKYSAGAVLHVNWTGVVSQLGINVLEAMRRVRCFTRKVAEFSRAGGRVVWSIHNVLPHEVRYRLPELYLLRELSKLADRILVMAPNTLDQVRDYYPLARSKVQVIPHPSYRGVYPDTTDRAKARVQLGLADTDIVAVALGVIRPYKNIELLSDAFDSARASEPDLRLLVVGEVGFGVDRARLVERLGRPGIRSKLRHIADSEVQVWLNSADFAVFAFSEGLNSGSLILGASFGLPAIVPGLASLDHLAASEWTLTIEPETDIEAVRSAFLAASRIYPGNSKARHAARLYASMHDPESVSTTFAATLSDVLN